MDSSYEHAQRRKAQRKHERECRQREKEHLRWKEADREAAARERDPERYDRYQSRMELLTFILSIAGIALIVLFAWYMSEYKEHKKKYTPRGEDTTILQEGSFE